MLDVPGLCCTARCTPIHWLSVCRHYSHGDNTPASATRSLPPALLQLRVFILILIWVLFSIGFEYYKFWPDGSKKQTHSRISVSITKQAVITPRSALLLYFAFDLVLDNYYFALMGVNDL